MVLFAILSFLFWNFKGKFSESISQNNIFFVLVLGLAIGYITADLSKSAIKKNKKENQ